VQKEPPQVSNVRRAVAGMHARPGRLLRQQPCARPWDRARSSRWRKVPAATAIARVGGQRSAPSAQPRVFCALALASLAGHLWPHASAAILLPRTFTLALSSGFQVGRVVISSHHSSLCSHRSVEMVLTSARSSI
jgi:hypothetical protein